MKRAMALALLGVVALASGNARAEDKATCIASFEKAAELRAARHYVDARRALVACGGSSCPVDVQRECAKELESLDDVLPAIVLVARDEAGRDRVEGRALVDGTPFVLDGRALPVDPGRHVVRFEVQGCEPAEQTVLVSDGERSRAIAATLRCAPASAAPPAPSAPSSAPASAPAGSESRSKALPITLAAVGVVGVIGFAYFGAKGKIEIDDIRATGCAPACDHDQVMGARAKLVVADVFGIVGLLGLGTAGWLTFAPP